MVTISNPAWRICKPVSKKLVATSIVGILLASSSVTAIAQERSKSSDCSPIGQVVSSPNPDIPGGVSLCRDQLAVAAGVTVRCKTGRTVAVDSLRNPEEIEKCEGKALSPKEVIEDACRSSSASACSTTRGQKKTHGLSIISPSEFMIKTSRPTFKWSSTGGKVYTIGVQGYKFRWQREISGTTMTYPKDVPDLPRGNVYTMVVRDDQGNRTETIFRVSK